MTAAERQQRKRDRLKAGLVRVEAWIPVQAESAVREAIAKAITDMPHPSGGSPDHPSEAPPRPA